MMSSTTQIFHWIVLRKVTTKSTRKTNNQNLKNRLQSPPRKIQVVTSSGPCRCSMRSDIFLGEKVMMMSHHPCGRPRSLTPTNLGTTWVSYHSNDERRSKNYSLLAPPGTRLSENIKHFNNNRDRRYPHRPSSTVTPQSQARSPSSLSTS